MDYKGMIFSTHDKNKQTKKLKICPTADDRKTNIRIELKDFCVYF